MKKPLVIILIFLNYNIFSQNKFIEDTNFFFNIGNLCVDVNYSDIVEANASLEVLTFYYIINRKFGFELSPLFTQFYQDDFYTWGFFNFRMHYYIMPYYEKDTLHFLLGPCASINWLNSNSIDGFKVNDIMITLGISLLCFKEREYSPMIMPIEFCIGYRFINYAVKKHNLFIGCKSNIAILFWFFSKRAG
jgi:hypothetical protein